MEGIEGRIDEPASSAAGSDLRSERVGGGSGDDISGADGGRTGGMAGTCGICGRRVLGSMSSGDVMGAEARAGAAVTTGCGWI